MSNPHVIISAVHPLEDEVSEDFWNDEDVRDSLHEINYDDYEPRFSEACFKSDVTDETYFVETSHHMSRDGIVAEIILDGRGYRAVESIAITNLEEIIEEINSRFERDFTLEAYYWYDGVDKPGAAGETGGNYDQF